jgi:thioredoxin reductase
VSQSSRACELFVRVGRQTHDVDTYDVVIVGGGPAGLSAALILGRCRRRVLLCDGGSPRNARATALHSYLTRDGIEPAELLHIGRQQLEKYPNVELRSIEVVDAVRSNNGFVLSLKNDSSVFCSKLLLATGVVDDLPDIEGLHELYGRSVFHCPYCDGWEVQNQAIAVCGNTEGAVGLALKLTLWSGDILLCATGVSDNDRQLLRRNRIKLREDKIVRLKGEDGRLTQIDFEDGQSVARECLFFSTKNHQHSDLAERLGCEFSEEGCVRTGTYETTSVKGVYVAGDASRLVQLAIVAASEGAQAAFAINEELLKEDLGT